MILKSTNYDLVIILWQFILENIVVCMFCYCRIYICPPSVKPNLQMINSINLLLYKYACWLIVMIDLFDITHRLAMHIILMLTGSEKKIQRRLCCLYVH